MMECASTTMLPAPPKYKAQFDIIKFIYRANRAMATVHDASQNSKFRAGPTCSSFPSFPPILVLLGILPIVSILPHLCY